MSVLRPAGGGRGLLHQDVGRGAARIEVRALRMGGAVVAYVDAQTAGKTGLRPVLGPGRPSRPDGGYRWRRANDKLRVLATVLPKEREVSVFTGRVT
ncbi:hypothetical protein ACGFI3_17790 [Nonomuraea wenchangensis]|uniref:hypothetical protein n=1 Tax=Nonomuraea wenchangensis TaxID=568860 RepID=UPI00371A8C00